jgi:hypothetical protein
LWQGRTNRALEIFQTCQGAAATMRSKPSPSGALECSGPQGRHSDDIHHRTIPTVNHEFVVAQARVKQTAADLIAIGQDLNHERVGFLRPGNSTAQMIDAAEKMVPIERWPTSEDIMLMLRALEDARAKLLSFHSSLSAADREALRPLPQGVRRNKTFARKPRPSL